MLSLVFIPAFLLVALGLIVGFWKRAGEHLRQERSLRQFGAYLTANLMVAVGIFLLTLVAGAIPSFLVGDDWTLLFLGGLLVSPFIGAMWLIGAVLYWFGASRPRGGGVREKEKRKNEQRYSPAFTTMMQTVNSSVFEKRKIGDDGEIVDIVDDRQSRFSFAGSGRQVTTPLYLAMGRYRIGYKFPVDGTTAVRLTHTTDLTIAEEQILCEGGTGSSYFVVKIPGTYVLQIIPMAPPGAAHWYIEIQPL